MQCVSASKKLSNLPGIQARAKLFSGIGRKPDWSYNPQISALTKAKNESAQVTKLKNERDRLQVELAILREEG